jgi:hypothetical protein
LSALGLDLFGRAPDELRLNGVVDGRGDQHACQSVTSSEAFQSEIEVGRVADHCFDRSGWRPVTGDLRIVVHQPAPLADPGALTTHEQLIHIWTC